MRFRVLYLTAESVRSLLWLQYPTNMKLLYGITPTLADRREMQPQPRLRAFLVLMNQQKKMPWREEATDVEDYLAGSRAIRPTLLLQVEMRSTPMPPRVKGRWHRDAIGVHQSGIEPFRCVIACSQGQHPEPCH